MPLPAFLLPLIGAIGGASSGMLGQRSAANKSKADIALEESMADPFRHQMAQAGHIGRLDMMQNMSHAPTTVAPPERYAGRTGTFDMTPSYAPSPDVAASAGAIKASVMGGRTAPTMTNDKNYGRTGALDLLRVAAGGIDPSTDAAFAQPSPGRQAIRGFQRGARNSAAAGWEIDAFGNPRRITAPRPWEA